MICLKNVVIGSDKQKGLVISQGIVPRLMQILSDDNLPLSIRYDAAIILGKHAFVGKMLFPLLNRNEECDFNLITLSQVHCRKERMKMYVH